MYQHLDWQGQAIGLPAGKVVCIGQNYQDHIAEMQSKTAPEALFFIKPSTALASLTPVFNIPQGRGDVHNELEIAVLICQPLTQANFEQVNEAIWGYGVALDLTLRQLQAGLKQLGRPWEIAKGFDGACPMSPWVPKAAVQHPQQLDFSLLVNGELRQQGNSANMIRGITQLISEMSHCFTLLPGDLVLTGTPAGVGPLQKGDQLSVIFSDLLKLDSWVEV